MKIVVILAGARLLPKGVIQFGREGQFTEEIAEGFVHDNSGRFSCLDIFLRIRVQWRLSTSSQINKPYFP